MRAVFLGISLAALLFLLFLTSNQGYKVSGQLNVEQKKYRDLIKDQAKALGYFNVSMLQGLALAESSLNPLAHSKKDSYGLLQLFHAPNFSWLRWAGYKDSDINRLYDPVFNINLGISVVRYFEGRGYKFPEQSDIYNVGETEWKKGVRNEDYRNKVILYTKEFSEGKL